MRRILMNYARDQQRLKRGGGAIQVSLSEASVISLARTSDLIALDQSLEKLAKVDERKARVVELRHFGGLSVEETAEVLKVSPFTIARDWTLAKAWLQRELSGGSDST